MFFHPFISPRGACKRSSRRLKYTQVRDMKKYVIQRFIQLIPVLIGITFLSFAMMRMAGSDAITELYGDKGAVA